MKVGPIGFLFLVVGGWAAVRAVMLWPQEGAPRPTRRIVWQHAVRLTSPDEAVDHDPAAPLRSAAQDRKRAAPGAAADPVAASEMALALPAGTPGGSPTVTRRNLNPIYSPERVQPEPPSRRHLSVSAWSIVRGRGGAGLASAGQLGGSQAGVRAGYALGSGFVAALRLSGPLRSRFGKEAALALDWKPLAHAPFSLTIERRLGLDKGGRNAFAVGAFGGFATALPLHLGLDGYGQVGIVGARRRDGYVDGALRLERSVLRAGKLRIGAGAGLWGGAQPGAARVEAGPQLVAHVPVSGATLRIGAEWRERVAGRARPGSGAVLTMGADF